MLNREGEVAEFVRVRGEELLAQGIGVTLVAKRLGISYQSFYRILKKDPKETEFSLNNRKKARDEAALKRMMDIVELRKSGLTLKLIASQYGVTRERIRQILIHHGDSELLGADYKYSRIDWKCPICGRILRLRPSDTKHRLYCSKPCKKTHCLRNYLAKNREAVTKAVEMRLRGYTWKAISNHLGRSLQHLIQNTTIAHRAGEIDKETFEKICPRTSTRLTQDHEIKSTTSQASAEQATVLEPKV